MDSISETLTTAVSIGGSSGQTVQQQALIDPATLSAPAQWAYVSQLYSGRSLSSQDVQRAIQRESFKAQHQGHEGKHFAMFIIFVCVLTMLPSIVTFWRQRHPLSYRLISIGSICLIPVYFALTNNYYRFVCIWTVYAVANTYVLYLATRNPLHMHTPRWVYQWFAFINKVSYVVFVVGFVLFLLCFFNIMPGLTDTDYYVESSMLTMFYGLYFGLMSRDLVTLCTDKIAATLGYSVVSNRLPTKSLPREVCCICGDMSTSNAPNRQTTAVSEPTHALGCGHEFHASCIRGWCVIGKKDICPFCREKVDLQEFSHNPWDKQELFYVTALEYMRFFVSWQPLTLLFVAGVFWVLGLN
ncbi:RING finger protein [Coemansia spiralis]|nr:RING finger protein [Coemansia spiralis]